MRGQGRTQAPGGQAGGLHSRGPLPSTGSGFTLRVCLTIQAAGLPRAQESALQQSGRDQHLGAHTGAGLKSARGEGAAVHTELRGLAVRWPCEPPRGPCSGPRPLGPWTLETEGNMHKASGPWTTVLPLERWGHLCLRDRGVWTGSDRNA